MIKTVSDQVQVIVATQSPLLVDAFDLEEIMVLEAADGRTNFSHLNVDDYRCWLDENYAPGELWQKNLLGGAAVIRLAVSVEGQTEEEFVKRVLSAHLH